jgi:hypothetical protein
MKSISTEILIDSSREKVWNILSDFPSYPDWNPFITEISGNLKMGSALKVTLEIEGRKPTSFIPRIIIVIPGEKLCWKGKTIVRGLFDGTHYFILEETGDGKTHLTQGENFSGLLAGAILSRIETATLAGFERMNLALKEKAEN